MKNIDIITTIQKFAPAVRGVYTLSDLQVVLDTKHPRTFYLRLKMLEEQGLLKRFARGVYVTKEFDPALLSQTLCPGSCISFEYVLARHLVIGSGAGNRIRAVKIGKKRIYTAPGISVSIEHLGIRESLLTAFETIDGVRYAIPEKALLDSLYFHTRGYLFNFDIYSDPDLSRLDMQKLMTCLQLYENPKFITFAKGVLNELS